MKNQALKKIHLLSFLLILSGKEIIAQARSPMNYNEFLLQNNKQIGDALLNGNFSSATSLTIQAVLQNRLTPISPQDTPVVFVTLNSRATNVAQELALAVAEKSYRLVNEKCIILRGFEQTQQELYDALNAFFSVFGYEKQLAYLEKKREALQIEEKKSIDQVVSRVNELQKKAPQYNFSYLQNLVDEWRATDYLFIINQQIIYEKTVIPQKFITAKKEHSVNTLLSFIDRIDKETKNNYFPVLTRPDIQKIGSLQEIKKFLVSDGVKELLLIKNKCLRYLKMTEEKIKNMLLKQKNSP